MSDEQTDDELDLNELSDNELVEQMHDDLYDGLRDEIVEGTVKEIVDRAGLFVLHAGYPVPTG